MTEAIDVALGYQRAPIAGIKPLDGACTVLVVDPPWSYGSDTGRTRTAEKHYATMGNGGKEVNRKTGAGIQTIIEATPVQRMAAASAHLYLWTTNPKLPFAFDVMRAWGFDYKTTLTWVKTREDGVLFGTRGNKGIPSAMRRPNVILAPTGEHSEKPAAFYELLRGIYPESETMADLYARKEHARFHAWGDQAPSNASSSRARPKRGKRRPSRAVSPRIGR